MAELPAADFTSEQKRALPLPQVRIEQQPGVGRVALQGDRPQGVQFRVSGQGVLVESVAAGRDEVIAHQGEIRHGAALPALREAEGLGGLLDVFKIIFALLDVRAHGGEQQVFDLHVEAVGDFDKGVEEGADFLRLVGHHLEQAGRREAEDFQGHLLQNAGLEHAGERMEFVPEMERDEIFGFRVFFPFFDLTEIGDGHAGAISEFRQRKVMLLAELIEFQAQDKAQVLLARRHEGAGRQGLRGRGGREHGGAGLRPGRSGIDEKIRKQLVSVGRVVRVAAEIRPAAGAEKILVEQGLARE